MHSIDIAGLFSSLRMRVLVFLFKIEPFPVSCKGLVLFFFVQLILFSSIGLYIFIDFPDVFAYVERNISFLQKEVGKIYYMQLG